MPNATSNRLNEERRERTENRYLDPASERYASQLAAVVFGWGTWSFDALADDELLADSSRMHAEAPAPLPADTTEAWALALADANIKSARARHSGRSTPRQASKTGSSRRSA